MDFGQVPDPSQVDFRLPPSDPANDVLLGRLKKFAGQTARRVHVGCPVWQCKEWLGNVYPPRTRPQDFLFYYSRQFNAIELNSTYYAIPSASTLLRWRAVTPEGFRFCPKVPLAVSRELRAASSVETFQRFAEAMKNLEDRLGLCFLQCPPTIRFEHRGLLEPILRVAARSALPLAIEFRHASFFETGGRLASEARALLEATGCALVATDTGGRRDVVHGSVTAPEALVRFLGNALHESDFSRMKVWVGRLKSWHATGLASSYLFVHQMDARHAAQLCAFAVSEFNEGLAEPVLTPWASYEQSSALF